MSDDDRKYRHRGYQDSGKDEIRRRSGPRGPRPEGPRGRGIDLDKAVVFSCRSCGNKRKDFEDLRTDSTCEKCGANLHSCRQCANFDTSARFECTKPIPVRIADKNAKNACRFYVPVKSFDLDGTRALDSPEDARAAFDRLFSKK
jgi:hypothetical protein